MTISELKYLKDTQDKATKVIESCETKDQLIAAEKYINLLGARWTDKFDLDNDIFKINTKNYRLCRNMYCSLKNKIKNNYETIK